MLPCQQNCPNFKSGCHKTCLSWKEFQQGQTRKRQAQKQYLKFYNELCTDRTQQLLAMQARRPIW